MTDIVDQRGMYNQGYFSGSQAAVYIGDIWVDDINYIEWTLQQTRTPLYGYNDTLFRDVSKGQVIVQGSFRINFREAGYLFLILDRYRSIMKGETSLIKGGIKEDATIESVINGTANPLTRADVNRSLSGYSQSEKEFDRTQQLTSAFLRGYSNIKSNPTARFDELEQEIWGSGKNGTTTNILESTARRADYPDLNPFDIFVTFGEHNSKHATIQKLTNVHILGNNKSIAVGAEPIQEIYTFIARNVL
jgi:hypothetical protein